MSEFEEQALLIDWTNLNKQRYPDLDLIFAIPNAAKRTKTTRNKMLREGLKSGVPDLFLPVPKKPHHGLWIEMKFGKNKTTANQDRWINRLQAKGYKVLICYSGQEAISEIEKYLGIE